jgi:hypothetical protein
MTNPQGSTSRQDWSMLKVMEVAVIFRDVKNMSKTTVVSLLLGALSYLFFLFMVLRKGLSYIFAVGTAPLLFLFPQLNDPNMGMSGVPVMLFGGVLGFLIIALSIRGTLKALKVPFSFGSFMAGFFGLAVVVNLVYILFRR